MPQMSGLGTTRTNVHDCQYAEDAENMTCIMTATKSAFVVFLAICQGNHSVGSRDCEVSKKDYQTKTYSKYHIPKRKKDNRLQNMWKC